MLANLFRRLLGSGRPAPAGPLENELGYAIQLQQNGELAQAEAAYREFLKRHAGNADVLHLLGSNLMLQCRYDEAIKLLQQVAAARPDSAEVFYNLGSAFSACGDHGSALTSYRTVIALRPEFVEALSNLAGVLKAVGDYDEAEACYRKALALRPDFAEGHYNLANLLHLLGRLEEAVASYRRAIEIKPDFVTAHSSLVYSLNFRLDYDPHAVFQAHLDWARRHAEPLKQFAAPHRNTAVAERRMRVGYVSPNFRDHAAAYFFEPVLAHHDVRQFEVFCYSDVAHPDEHTRRLRQYQATWRDCAQIDDAALAELVRGDAIDVLVDLTGHTENNRLLMFARKPAPVQVTWNGYANTTGMSAIDYRISDAYADPPGMTEHLHTERLVRLPDIYMVFRPPDDSPPVNELPAAQAGYVTFGSFNAFAKITPQCIALWARVLNAAPASRLIMATVPAGNTRQRVAQLFAAHGIDASRLELHDMLPFQHFLALHQRADIALDPFPFHGTTTTCHTLWMGLPVVTRAGASHASRVGVSMLSNLGLARLVAQSDDEYVTIARSLAADLTGLKNLRAGLRDQLLGAPNTDGLRLTRHLERAYRDMWRTWCRAQTVNIAGQK